jgi:hypothetical protein
VSEYHYRFFMRGSRFYLVAGIAFPIILAAAARAGRMRWPAVMTAAVYSAATLAMMWILPLFPAEPKLAPVYNPVTRMVPPSFPLLLIVPAIALDLIVRRWRPAEAAGTLARHGREALLALCLGAAFVLVLLAAQWPFAGFLLSDWAQNPVFAGNNFPYQVPHDTYYYRRLFLPFEGIGPFTAGIGKAILAAAISARIGLAWGSWMRRVAR